MTVAKIPGLPRITLKRYNISSEPPHLMEISPSGNWIEYTEDVEFRLKLSHMALGAFTEALKKQCHDNLTAEARRMHEEKGKK